MLVLLLIPILISGYIAITFVPREKIRISLYHGWSIYLRAATFGFVAVLFSFVLFSHLLPWLYQNTSVTYIPERDIILWLSEHIHNGLRSESLKIIKDEDEGAYSYLTSLSIISISVTFIACLIIRVLWVSKPKSIRKLFQEKTTLDYLLTIIAEKIDSDLKYNKSLDAYHQKMINEIHNGRIEADQNDIEKLNNKIEGQKAEIGYALITLDNRKFYIGMPSIVPPPDEESVASNSFMIIPEISGYREQDSLSLKFTTRYQFEPDRSLHLNGVSIPRDKIISISSFSFENYKKLNSAQSRLHEGE